MLRLRDVGVGRGQGKSGRVRTEGVCSGREERRSVLQATKLGKLYTVRYDLYDLKN